MYDACVHSYEDIDAQGVIVAAGEYVNVDLVIPEFFPRPSPQAGHQGAGTASLRRPQSAPMPSLLGFGRASTQRHVFCIMKHRG
jgi:hypothetical protein